MDEPLQISPRFKQQVDAMSYETLLDCWRHSPVGSPMFQGDNGKYVQQRMRELRAAPNGDAMHTAASKAVGW